MRSFNNPPAHRPQTPACVWRPLKEPHLHVCWHICVPATGKTEANAVGSCLNYCSTKSTWQLAVFSMEKSVFPPTRLVFFSVVKDACMSVLWARASLLFAYNPVWKPMCTTQTGKSSGVSYPGNSHQRDSSFGMHVSFSASFPVCISLHFRPFIPLCCEHFVIPSPIRSLLKHASQILSSCCFLTELAVHLLLLKWAIYLKVVGQIGKKKDISLMSWHQIMTSLRSNREQKVCFKLC